MHIVLTNLLLFLKGKNKNWVNWENWIRGGPFFKKIIRSKGEEREKIHNLEWWDVFCFDLLTINYHGNWYFLYICIYIPVYKYMYISNIYYTYIHWSFSSAYYRDNISSDNTYCLWYFKEDLCGMTYWPNVFKEDLCFYWQEMAF